MIKIQRLLASWANLAFGLGLDFRPSGSLLTGGGANGARKEDWTEVYKSSIWSSWLLTRPRPNWSLTQSLKICFCIFLSTSTVACPKRQTTVLNGKSTFLGCFPSKLDTILCRQKSSQGLSSLQISPSLFGKELREVDLPFRTGNSNEHRKRNLSFAYIYYLAYN